MATAPTPAGATEQADGSTRSPKALIAAVDRWQRRHRVPSLLWGVLKKFGDDEGNLLTVALGWYGFTSIYPLLLVVVTIFGYIGVGSLGHGIVSTLHQFPVIGAEFTVGRGGDDLHGSAFALVVGVVGLVYGAQGVTQVAQRAMQRVWNLPRDEQVGFVPRLVRSVAALVTIGGTFVLNAFLGSLATSGGRSLWLRILLIAVMVVVNVGLFTLSFRILTPAPIATGSLVAGAAVAAVAFTLLITVGTGLISHKLKDETATYGAFASVIGVVAFLLILAKLTIYAAELNPVRQRNLVPRSILGPPIEADRRVADLRARESEMAAQP